MAGEYNHIKNVIEYFCGIYVALQQIQVNGDEGYVLRGWEFVQSLLAATVTTDDCVVEDLSYRNREEFVVSKLIMQSVEGDDESGTGNELKNSSSIKRLCVTNW